MEIRPWERMGREMTRPAGQIDDNTSGPIGTPGTVVLGAVSFGANLLGGFVWGGIAALIANAVVGRKGGKSKKRRR